MNQSNSLSIKKERNSSIELLRIIAMYMIVIYHYVLYNGFNLESAEFGIQKFAYQIFHTGQTGVDIFVLISGFFGYKSKANPKRVLNLILQALFYSVLISAAMLITGNAEMSASYIIKSVFPVLFKQYWFLTAYVVLMLLSPYINTCINSISRQNHLKLIFIMVILWSIIPFFTDQDYYSNNITSLIMLYIIGAYLGKYPDNLLGRKKNAEILTVVSVVILVGITLALGLAGKYVPLFRNLSPHFYTSLSPLALSFSVGILMTFSKMKFRSSFINKAAACTFGVYLIHENPNFYPVLWKKYLHSAYFVNTKYWFVYMILCTVLVYVVCSVIEYIRKNTIAKPLEKFAGRLYDKTADFISGIIESVKKKLST